MRKAVAGVLVFVLLLLGMSGGVLAQDTDRLYNYEVTEDEFAEYNAAVQNCDTPSLECLVRYTTRFVAMEWVNDIAGVQKLGGGGGGTSSVDQPGVVAGTFTLISSMYAYKPANTGRYVADVVNSAGFATPAYAQGLGFASLDPILQLWKMFRNVAYFFFIIAFIIIGFMIMFRAKVGSQAAITAQQAIPSVIISLVLVTFSYAIAGFMIDLMYLLMFMIVGLFEGLTVSTLQQSDIGPSDLISFNILNVISFFFSNTFNFQAFDTNTQITEVVLRAAGASGLLNSVGSFLGGLTLTIIVTIAALIGTVKLFFELLKSYASIILSVVTAPIYLMMGAIPGSNVFWPWLKNIIGNLMAFPTVLLMLILFIEFAGGSNASVSAQSGGFMPPFLLGGPGVAGIVGPIMGLAIILAMPEIVKKIKEATGAKDGGFAGMIASAAIDRGKEAWGGKGIMGVNAKGVLGTSALTAATVAGVPVGAAVGGAISSARGGSFRSGARTGAITGLAAPFGIKQGLPMIKEAGKIAKTEVSQYLADESVGYVLNKGSQQQGKLRSEGQGRFAGRTKGATQDNNQGPEAATTTQTRDAGDSLTS